MDSPPSPCNGICRIEPATGLCAGCHRTLAEIAAWPKLPPQAKQAVLSELPARALR